MLHQYKERKPRDPTIREKFNTYRFSDHKERVIDLLRRVCTVSVAKTVIVDSMVHRGETWWRTATATKTTTQATVKSQYPWNSVTPEWLSNQPCRSLYPFDSKHD